MSEVATSSSHLRLKDEQGPLILVSNRGPIEHAIDDNGHIRRREAGGGVAVALAAVARQQPVTWIAGASNFADRVVALTGQRVAIGRQSSLRLVSLPGEVYAPFYESFCNPLLWFVQHSIERELCRRSVADEALASYASGYVPANRLFAEAVVEEVDGHSGTPLVMLHDYHLYLAPRMIRSARPRMALQQFIHIPWPGPLAWFTLPQRLVRQICHGLLANDSLVFQTDRDVESFLLTCRAALGRDAVVTERLGEVEYLGHVTSVSSNPISVDVCELQDLAASDGVEAYCRELEEPRGRRLIVRVDRLDPSKNVLRGFEAFERLLERKPALCGSVTFLAFLVPSRAGIAEYDDYARRVFERVDAINKRFGTPEWTPVRVFHEHNRARAIAGLRMYDVLLVNSIADGMNLVSKEGPVVNERDGALVLSRTAGSFAELSSGALAIDPLDVETTAAALERALSMPAGERSLRSRTLRTTIQRHQLSDWLRHQLKDLAVTRYLKASRTVA